MNQALPDIFAKGHRLPDGTYIDLVKKGPSVPQVPPQPTPETSDPTPESRYESTKRKYEDKTIRKMVQTVLTKGATVGRKQVLRPIR